jgi:hypothetical protein
MQQKAKRGGKGDSLRFETNEMSDATSVTTMGYGVSGPGSILSVQRVRKPFLLCSASSCCSL